jgi:hypothetical protein
MEVGRDDLREALPFIKDCILGADFVAIDCEFPTLDVSECDYPSPYDTLEDRYQKMKTVSSQSWPC